MADLSTYLQTAAAICSAIAAIAAFWVAKNTFAFQRNSLLKKSTVEHMLKVLHQLYYLKSFTNQTVLGAADGDVTGLEQRISETRESVTVLETMVSGGAKARVGRVRDVVQNLRGENVFAGNDQTPNVALIAKLDGAICAIQEIYNREIK